MTAMASHSSSNMDVCSTANLIKHQSPALLGLCEGNALMAGVFLPQRVGNAESVEML